MISTQGGAMAKMLLLSAIREVLGIISHEKMTKEIPNLTDLVYGVFDKNVEEAIGVSKSEFCKRMEMSKWVEVGYYGEAKVTPEGANILDQIEAGEDLEKVIAEWESCLEK
jgi:hypothetical protein